MPCTARIHPLSLTDPVRPDCPVPSRRNHPAPGFHGRRVANKYRGKHIRTHFPQFPQGKNPRFLSFPSDISHIATDRIRAAVCQHNITGFLQIIRTFSAGGIVQADGHIADGSTAQPVADHVGVCQQIAETDDRKIMAQGSAQQCRAAAGCRDTGNHPDRRRILHPGRKLEDQPRHPVYPGIPAAYQGDSAPQGRLGKRPPLCFLPHGCGIIFFFRKPFF